MVALLDTVCWVTGTASSGLQEMCSNILSPEYGQGRLRIPRPQSHKLHSCNFFSLNM